jgi:hypothetical protein
MELLFWSLLLACAVICMVLSDKPLLDLTQTKPWPNRLKLHYSTKLGLVNHISAVVAGACIIVLIVGEDDMVSSKGALAWGITFSTWFMSSLLSSLYYRYKRRTA